MSNIGILFGFYLAVVPITSPELVNSINKKIQTRTVWKVYTSQLQFLMYRLEGELLCHGFSDWL